MQEFNLWQEGDGDQQLKFFLADIEWTLQDLLADPAMKGFQKFEFKEVKDSRGFRVFGEAWTSLKFQEAASIIGPGKVPLSLVLYIDGTFIKNGIDVRPLYSE